MLNNKTQNNLELGKYLESDMIALTEDEAVGGATPTIVLSIVTAFVSNNTCPTTACTSKGC